MARPYKEKQVCMRAENTVTFISEMCHPKANGDIVQANTKTDNDGRLVPWLMFRKFSVRIFCIFACQASDDTQNIQTQISQAWIV